MKRCSGGPWRHAGATALDDSRAEGVPNNELDPAEDSVEGGGVGLVFVYLRHFTEGGSGVAIRSPVCAECEWCDPDYTILKLCTEFILQIVSLILRIKIYRFEILRCPHSC